MILPSPSARYAWSPASAEHERFPEASATRFVSYIRSRPVRQAERVFGVDAQRLAVAFMLGEGDNVLLEEFWEMEFAKPRAAPSPALFSERPALNQAIQFCHTHDATLLIAHVGKLGSSRTFLRKLQQTRVRFVACDFPELDHSTIGDSIAKAALQAQ